MRVQAADAAEEALRHWKGWNKDSPTSQALHDDVLYSFEHPPCSTTEGDVATVYMAGVPARSARERQQVKPGVVRLANEGGAFLVSQGDSSKWLAPTHLFCLQRGISIGEVLWGYRH